MESQLNNAEVRDKIRTCIQRFLDLPPSAVLIYKQHDSRVSKGRSTYTPGASSGRGSGGGGPNGGGMAPSGSALVVVVVVVVQWAWEACK